MMTRRRKTDRGRPLGHGDPFDYDIPPLSRDEVAQIDAAVQLDLPRSDRALFLDGIARAIGKVVVELLVMPHAPTEQTVARALSKRATTIRKFVEAVYVEDPYDAVFETAESIATGEIFHKTIPTGELAQSEIDAFFRFLDKIIRISENKSHEFLNSSRNGDKYFGFYLDRILLDVKAAIEFAGHKTPLPGSTAAERNPEDYLLVRAYNSVLAIVASRLDEAARSGAPGAVEAAAKVRTRLVLSPLSAVRRMRVAIKRDTEEREQFDRILATETFDPFDPAN